MKNVCNALCLLVAVTVTFIACKNNGPADADKNNAAYSHPSIAAVTGEIEKEPANARLYFKRGLLLDDLQEDSLALKDYNKAISLDSTKAEFYSAVGELLFEHKDIDGSVKWLKKAL